MAVRDDLQGERMKESADPVFRVSGPRVIFECIDGELILVHMERGTYFSTDEVGAFIWSLIEGRASRTEILRAVEERYEDTGEGIVGAVARFLGRLLDEDLVAVEMESDESRLPMPPASGRKLPFVVPSLQAYQDMQDMLSLDPIHDVEAAGWPIPKMDDDPVAPLS